MGRKKKETPEEAYERGRVEIVEKVLTVFDDFLREQFKSRDLYPRNTKFVDIQIDAIEELRKNLLEVLDKRG